MKSVVFTICFGIFIECISSSITPRIIGGKNGDISKFAHQAMIRLRGHYHCSACIIGKRSVLGTASCFTNSTRTLPPSYTYSEFTVHTGTDNMHTPGHIHRIADVHFHPRWDTQTMANNIAVIEVKEAIVYDALQQEIPLAEHNIEGLQMGTMTGWGRTLKNNPNFAVHLQQINMTVLNRDECLRQFPREPVTEEQLCAYHVMLRGGSIGDTGDPMIVNNQVAGVFSHTIPMGRRKTVDMQILTNVFAHEAFIESKIRNN